MIKEWELLDISNEEYHAPNGYCSSSQIAAAYDDKVQYFKQINGLIPAKKNQSTAHFDIGTAFHTKILEPEKFNEEVTFTDMHRNGAKWDAFKAANKGKIILTPLQKATLGGILKITNDYKLAQPYIKNGVAEKSLFGEVNGFKRKARADKLLVGEWIMDLKTTTGRLTYTNLQKTIAYRHYDLSASWYLDLYNAAGFDLKEFIWIFASKDYPSCKVVKASKAMIENGRRKYTIGMQNMLEVKKKGFKVEEKIMIMEPAENDIVNVKLEGF